MPEVVGMFSRCSLVWKDSDSVGGGVGVTVLPLVVSSHSFSNFNVPFHNVIGVGA